MMQVRFWYNVCVATRSEETHRSQTNHCARDLSKNLVAIECDIHHVISMGKGLCKL